MIVTDRYNMTQEENIFCAKRIIVDSIYKQANLEGIAVTFAQTQDILNNVNVSELSPNDINRICCLRDGWNYLINTINDPLNVGYLQSIHELIARFDVSYNYLGKIRTEEILISGTNWRAGYPNVEEMHNTIQDFINNKNITNSAIKLGLYIMRVQPFKDGNKRVGSFAINKILISNGKGIFNVPIELDGKFKSMLVDYYETNNADLLTEWISENCLQGINEIPTQKRKSS